MVVFARSWFKPARIVSSIAPFSPNSQNWAPERRGVRRILGARDIDSAPTQRATRVSSIAVGIAICWSALTTAWKPEPQMRCTRSDGVSTGSPQRIETFRGK